MPALLSAETFIEKYKIKITVAVENILSNNEFYFSDKETQGAAN